MSSAPPPRDHRIAPTRLERFARAVCLAGGCDSEEAEAIAVHLVEANLAGHDSHGVAMLARYVPAMRDGRMALGRRSEVVRDLGAVVVLDGGTGVGQLLGREATAIGVERARRHGVALIALQRAHHLGRIGAWAEQCAAQGLASMHYVNVVGHRPYVAPFGGRDGRLSTNPVCIGLPATSRPPLILDMATSKVAFGKIAVARNRGVSAPDGALLDAAGNPTTDPAVMWDEPSGSLRPFGDHKGYGLALMCDVLAGALAAGGTNRPETQTADTLLNNMLSIVIDPSATTDATALAAEVDAHIAWVTASPPQDGVERVLVPGEPERLCRAQRERDGIPLDPMTWAELIDAARLAGCAETEIPMLSAPR